MAAIIILVLLIILTILVVVFNTISRSFIDKKNLIYFIPLFFILIVIHMIGFIENKGFLDGFGFFKCVLASFECFTFKLNEDILRTIVDKSPLYAFDVYYATSFAGLTFVSGIFGFFKVGLLNEISVIKKSFGKNLDIVIGDFELAKKYVSKNKNAILWVDSKEQKISSEEKGKLFSSKVTYVYRPLSGKRIKLLTFFNPHYVHIVCLQKDNSYIDNIFCLIPSLSNSREKGYRIHVESSGELLTFVDSKLSEECRKVKGVSASSFDIYELISRKFSSDYNLAEFLPRSYFVDGVMLPDKEVNVVMLGFGKTSKAMFKGLITNNQFVKLNKDHYEAKKINYYLYDQNQSRFDDSLLNYLQNFEMYTGKNDLQLCELPCNIYTKSINVKAPKDKEFIEKITPKENEFTFYFISLNNGVENAYIADTLERITDKDHSAIFFNVDDKKEILVGSNSRAIPYGYKNIILSHQYISNDELWELSSLHNKNYNKMSKNKGQEFTDIPIIEKMSNAYSVINYRFKLNVLGFDYTSEDSSESVNEEEFMKIYDKDNRRKEDKYENYFKVSARNAIAYQEHLRWSIFYIVNGFTVMPLKDIYFDEEKGNRVHKDIPNKKHACLVGYYELDKLIEYEKTLIPKGIKEYPDLDCFKYDYQSLDCLYETIGKAGYKIIKLK